MLFLTFEISASLVPKNEQNVENFAKNQQVLQCRPIILKKKKYHNTLILQKCVETKVSVCSKFS